MRDPEESKNAFAKPTKGIENCNERAESDEGCGDTTS